MEEIICHACGRPNLPEAKKCWYCQEALEKPDEGAAGESSPEINAFMPIDAGDGKTGEPLQQLDEPEEPDSDIPEWLQRIREMKKADQTPEDDQDRWQQQKLFSPAAAPVEPSAAAGAPKRSERPAPKPKPAADPQAKAPAAALPLEPIREPEDEAEAQTEPEDLSDDLPEGFKPIEDIDSN